MTPILNQGQQQRFLNGTKYVIFSACSLLIMLLFGCTPTHQSKQDNTQPVIAVDTNHPPDAIPKPEEYSRHGNASSYKVQGTRYYVLKSAENYEKTGMASWYGTKFHGRLTSNREPYDMYAMTAASPNLPIPSYVHVTNLENGRSITVRVNDRGPFQSDRIIDLSYAAAKKLGFVKQGTTKVRVTGIDATDEKTMLASQKKHQKAVLAHASGKAPKDTQTTQLAQHTTRPVYLQVGAYNVRDKALSVSKEVSNITRVDSTVKTAHNDKGPIYLVNVGPIVDGQTSEVRSVLARSGFEKPFEVGG